MWIEEIKEKYDKVIAWGAGNSFLHTHFEGLEITHLVDKDEKKWGCKVKDYIVKNPKEIICESMKNALIIIFSELYWKDIVIEIERLNIEADVVLSSMIKSYSVDENIYKKSFALYGEDAIIQGISDRYSISIERYIDIGANHPYRGNATILFYLNGAKGCLVEPNKSYHDKLAMCRCRDTIMCVGVASKDADGKEQEYYSIEGCDTRNTFSKEVADCYCEKGFVVKTEKIKLVSLDTIIDTYGEKINYISIDVEGLEYEILRTFDFKKYDVEIFNIEKGDIRVKELILFNDYEIVGETLSNWIFIKKGLLK